MRPWRLAMAWTVGLVGAAGLPAQDSASASAPPRGGSRSWVPPLASAVLPGSGQLLLGQDRGIVYVAIEAFALTAYLRQSSLGRDEGQRFRDLAFDVARRAFGPQVRDTAFEYFEIMTRYRDSGAFDRDPGPALAPETDPSTYNGSVWLLARETYWDDPAVPPDPASLEYFRAVQFYQERAIGPNYSWSWRNAPLEHQEFTAAIRRSDDAYRRAGNYLGLLLANHVLSAADALVSTRLSRLAGRAAALTTVVTPRGATAMVRLAW